MVLGNYGGSKDGPVLERFAHREVEQSPSRLHVPVSGTPGQPSLNRHSWQLHQGISPARIGCSDLIGGKATVRRALTAILVISLIGVAFSGTLTYRELCGATPAGGGCSAVGAPGTILGYPACVYGLAIYLLLVAIASFGLAAKE